MGGKDAAEVCRQIIQSFKMTTGSDLAEIADSNIYIAPAFVLTRDHTYPEWLQYIIINGNQAFPIPESEIAIHE